MNYQWIGNRPLHLSLLQTLDLESVWYTGMFPKFELTDDIPRDNIARYHMDFHIVQFNIRYIQSFINAFTITYFHELAHSTTYWNERFDRLIITNNKNDIVNLEERIADIVSFIWDECYNKKNINRKDFIRLAFEKNITSVGIPWGEVELAAKQYLKDKNCPKIESMLELYKNIIIEDNLSYVYEGLFNETERQRITA